jgi:hypothetical protein
MNIFPCLGTYLPILYSILFQEVDVFLWDLLFGVVALVYETEYLLVVVRILLGFFDPELLQVLECFGIVYVADQDDRVGPFVVGLGDAPEPFLPRSVPDLQLDVFLTDVQ